MSPGISRNLSAKQITYRAEKLGTRPRNPNKWTMCAGTCGQWIPWNAALSRPRGEATCQACRRARAKPPRHEGFCAQCGCIFQSGVPQLTCSRQCATLRRYGQPEIMGERVRNSEKTAMRRIRLRAQMVEIVDPVKVFDRNGWVCQLCSLPVDPSIKRTDRMGATLDHIVPLSLGGEHSYANVQLAHLSCNAAKGNGGRRATLVDGFLMLGPKPPKRCACGLFMTYLSGASWRCYTCKPMRGALPGMTRADAINRARVAMAIRTQGFSWKVIAELCEYDDHNKARSSALYLSSV